MQITQLTNLFWTQPPAPAPAPTGQGANREPGSGWDEVVQAPLAWLGLLNPAVGICQAVRALPELSQALSGLAGKARDWAVSWHVAETPEQQLDNVEQGQAQNCGALAVVKAMQHSFGKDACQTETLPDGSVKVTMRDGHEEILTPEELEQARKASGISGENQAAVDQANLLLAAAAKRYAEEKGVSFEEGLAFINGKNWPDQVAGYFGVEARHVDPKTLDDNGYAIVSNGTHAAVVVRTPDGRLVQDDHGQGTDYAGEVTSNGDDTGEATDAIVIVDKGSPEQEKSQGVGWGYVARLLSRIFGPAPGEGAETGSNGQAPDAAQVAGTDAVQKGVEQSTAAETGTSQDLETVEKQQQLAEAAQDQATVGQAQAGASEEAAASCSEQASELEAQSERASAERQERSSALQAQLQQTLSQLSASQKELGLLRDRVCNARFQLSELESQRELLAAEDFFLNLGEIERLDNLSYHVREALTQDTEQVRRLEREVDHLVQLAGRQDAAGDELRAQDAEQDERTTRRREALHQEGSALRQEARQRREAVSEGLARPELKDLWSSLSSPEDLADGARKRADQVRTREYEAAEGIRANVNFLNGYGSLERNLNGHATSTEQALDRVTLAMSWVDPNQPTKKAQERPRTLS